MRTARVAAQAKLNLFLRIVGREPGGFHRLSTLFQRVALADSVTVRADVAGRSLECTGADVGPVERNLAWRAALAYAAAAGWPGGFAIEIEKRIPVGGGLGGGSADAAAVLRALDALAPQPLAEERLAAIAFDLGADVPFLASAHALALGTGRGERLIALPPLPARDVLLLLPPFGVSSKDAFGWHAARQGQAPYDTAPQLLPQPLSWAAVEALAANDLEPAVFEKHAELRSLREALASLGARIARMSGSGSTVFGVFDDPAFIRGVDDAIRGAGARAVATSTVTEVAAVVLE